jgi:hypothetical protein
VAAAASPVTYAAQGQPPVLVESGYSDTGIPYATQGELQAAYAALTPPVVSQWIVFGQTGPQYFHDLDLAYYNPCSSDPDGPEPAPCGSAGAAFSNIWTFLQSNPQP